MTLTAHLYRLYRKYMHRQTGLFCAFWKIFLLCFLGLQSFSLFAQNSAVRIDAPLKLVIPFGPGSGTDIYARMVAQSLSQAVGRIGKEVQKIASSPELRSQLEAGGITVQSSSEQEFTELIKKTSEQINRIVKSAGITF